MACAEADSRAAHARIVDAVIAGDDGNAHTEMARHLDEVTGWLDSYRATDRRGASTCPPPATPLTEGSHTKLAEVVAARIHEQIVTDGRRLGEVVGSEADLCSRYQISRAVLREAVRLLEHHAVARMRRGPGGGLIVTAPELAASIEAMALYLDYRSVNRDDLRAVREAIELGCIQRLIAGRHDPAMAARLLATVQAVIDDQADDRAAADQFHADLADLSGNAVLPVLLRILTELWCRHAAGPPSGATGTASEPHRVHRRILEAIVDGDEGLARHRMRRHLAALTAWWH
ncbi:MAG TPA: FCD domain-containing protein [Pseudonocardiaceae bacterium]